MRRTLEYIGTRSMNYRTRRLFPGDIITCSGPAARALIATKKFRGDRPRAELPPPPAELLAKFDHDHDGAPGGSIAPAPSDDLKALRAEYFGKLGKRPFPGWGADTLREKIAAA